MGCDVHPIIQYKEFEAPEYWKTAGVPDDNRNYALFGALAGVRNHDVTPLCQPRGLPPDLSEDDIKKLYDGYLLSGGHTPTWFTLAEAEAYNTKDLDYGLEQWNRWLEYGRFIAKHFDKMPEQVRFVMDFDS